MKKVLINLTFLVGVSATVAGVAYAVFSNTVRNTGNVLGTSTLEIELTGKGSASTSVFNLENLMPGDTAVGCLQVANTGEADLIFRAYAETTKSLPGSFVDQIIIDQVILNSPNCRIDENYDQYGPDSSPIALPLNPMTLRDLSNVNNALNNVNAAFADVPLQNNFAATYEITIKAPLTMGNAYQDASYSGNIVVQATQFANQVQTGIIWQ